MPEKDRTAAQTQSLYGALRWGCAIFFCLGLRVPGTNGAELGQRTADSDTHTARDRAGHAAKHRIIQQEPMRSLFLSWRTCRSLPDGICLRLSLSAASCSCWKYAWQRRLRIPLHPTAPRQHQVRPFMNPGQFMSVGGKWRGSIGQGTGKGQGQSQQKASARKGQRRGRPAKTQHPCKRGCRKKESAPLARIYLHVGDQ